MRTVGIFVAGGAATWLIRVAFIALAPSGHPPAAVARVLRYAAPAAFASLVATNVHTAATGSGALAGWPVVAATGLTLLVAWHTRRSVITIAAGAAAVTVLSLL